MAAVAIQPATAAAATVLHMEAADTPPAMVARVEFLMVARATPLVMEAAVTAAPEQFTTVHPTQLTQIQLSTSLPAQPLMTRYI